MKGFTGFIAYPSAPTEIGSVLEAARQHVNDQAAPRTLTSWPQTDVAGRFLVDPIVSDLSRVDILIADITRLNFNVVYEVGYAIGLRKRVFLVKNAALVGDDDLIQEVGIFDTLGYKPYKSAGELGSILFGIRDAVALPLPTATNTRAPLYVVLPRDKTDDEIRLVSRIKKARIMLRSFDPEEQGRMAAPKAIDAIGTSIGVVIPFLGPHRAAARVHNLRAAFAAGLSQGMGKLTLLLQKGEDPVPLDYRDVVRSYRSKEQIDGFVSEFAPQVYEQSLSVADVGPAGKQNLLARVALGASAAEDEFSTLGRYYIRREEFERVLRGEIRLVVGRKGSGKTAVFGQIRDKLRRDRQRIVLDLRPEGFRLLQFKEQVLDLVQQGTKEHVMTAFWEYLLLLEACHKILDKDRELHVNDHRLYSPYRELAVAYREDAFVAEGDFAERMSRLLERISQDFNDRFTPSAEARTLTASQVTQLLYQHDIARLRRLVFRYLEFKNGLWILFDNLDKGWPPCGLTPDDVSAFRALLDAITKITQELHNLGQVCVGTVFVRNDVYEWLLQGTSDRGKISHVLVDWSDPDLLREVVRKRIATSLGLDEEPFDRLWNQICVSHIDGEETSQYLIDRSLMRPRGLIDLIQFCRSRALNLNHERIEVDDIREGESLYSTEVVQNLGFEMRDIFPASKDVLYQLLGRHCWLKESELKDALNRAALDARDHERMINVLLWYGVLGVVRDSTDAAFIYTVRYDLRRLLAIASGTSGEPIYCINPAVWAGLEIKNP